MSQSNRALALRWMQEVWNDRSDQLITELLTNETIGHLEGSVTKGPTEWKAARDILLSAFPDLKIVVEDSVSDGERVALRWSVTATHLGDSLGFPATGSAVSFAGMTWMLFQDGRIIEGWDAWNPTALIERLRVVVQTQAGTKTSS